MLYGLHTSVQSYGTIVHQQDFQQRQQQNYQCSTISQASKQDTPTCTESTLYNTCQPILGGFETVQNPRQAFESRGSKRARRSPRFSAELGEGHEVPYTAQQQSGDSLSASSAALVQFPTAYHHHLSPPQMELEWPRVYHHHRLSASVSTSSTDMARMHAVPDGRRPVNRSFNDADQESMPAPLPPPLGPKMRFSEEEDALLVELKETTDLTWKQIAEFFPGRTSGTLQVRYCTKLKEKPADWDVEHVYFHLPTFVMGR